MKKFVLHQRRSAGLNQLNQEEELRKREEPCFAGEKCSDREY